MFRKGYIISWFTVHHFLVEKKNPNFLHFLFQYKGLYKFLYIFPCREDLKPFLVLLLLFYKESLILLGLIYPYITILHPLPIYMVAQIWLKVSGATVLMTKNRNVCNGRMKIKQTLKETPINLYNKT